MTKEYKHLLIREVGRGGHKQRPFYGVYSPKDKALLGRIEYFSTWNKFIFEPQQGAIFDASCLTDITDFLTNHAGK